MKTLSDSKAGVRVQIFVKTDPLRLERAINQFAKFADVVDIQYQRVATSTGGHDFSAMVIYKAK